VLCLALAALLVMNCSVEQDVLRVLIDDRAGRP